MPRKLNRLYFAQRAEQSRIAMMAAVGDGARLAHRQLMQAYAVLAAPDRKASPGEEEALSRWDDEGGSAG